MVPTVAKSFPWRGTRKTRLSRPTVTGRVTVMVGKTTLSSRAISRRRSMGTKGKSGWHDVNATERPRSWEWRARPWTPVLLQTEEIVIKRPDMSETKDALDE